jgi:hypothetical protein
LRSHFANTVSARPVQCSVRNSGAAGNDIDQQILQKPSRPFSLLHLYRRNIGASCIAVTACMPVNFLPFAWRIGKETFQLHKLCGTNFYELHKRVLSRGNRVFRMGNVALRQESIASFSCA